jgi:hypothetical protein
MVVLASGITPDLEDDGAERFSAPSDRTELLRIIVLLVNQVRLVKDLLRFFQADAVLSFDGSALRWIKIEAHIRYNCYTIDGELKFAAHAEACATTPSRIIDPNGHADRKSMDAAARVDGG